MALKPNIKFPGIVTGIVPFHGRLLVYTTKRTYELTRVPETWVEHVRLWLAIWLPEAWDRLSGRKPYT